MHFAVTGSNGFVGLRLTRMLRRAGHEVTAFTRGEPENVEGVRAARWDVTSDSVPLSVLESVECIVHAAVYRPSVATDPAAAAPCLAVNALGTLKVLLAAEGAKVPHTVVLSAGNVYDPELEIAGEDARVWPVAHAPYYLSSKWIGDVYAEQFRLGRGLGVTTLRPSSIYGPGMKAGVVRAFVERALAGAPIEVDGDGSYATDLVSVDDVVAATLAAAERRPGGIINIGSGTATTLLELAGTVVRVVGGSVEVRRRGGSQRTRGFAPLAIAHARETLGYVPTPLEEGIRAYVSSMRGEDV